MKVIFMQQPTYSLRPDEQTHPFEPEQSHSWDGIAPQQSVDFSVAALTDCGRVRSDNQDTVLLRSLEFAGGGRAYLCAVADGMGGAQSGAVASALAISTLNQLVSQMLDQLSPEQDAEWLALLEQIFAAINQIVFKASREHPHQRGMGTTLTTALIIGQHVYLGSVGDSRAYRISHVGSAARDDARATQLTSDHTIAARMVRTGQLNAQEARQHPKRHMLYRSIGTNAAVTVDTTALRLGDDDALLLCSDGLTSHVYDVELAQCVRDHSHAEQGCDALVNLANQRGGLDNISVLIIRP
jgi:PPM family protein phosphatase